MNTILENTIEFDANNNATVIGAIAHEFYYTKAMFNKLCDEKPENLLVIRPNLMVSLGWKHLQAVKVKKNFYKISFYQHQN